MCVLFGVSDETFILTAKSLKRLWQNAFDDLDGLASPNINTCRVWETHACLHNKALQYVEALNAVHKGWGYYKTIQFKEGCRSHHSHHPQSTVECDLFRCDNKLVYTICIYLYSFPPVITPGFQRKTYNPMASYCYFGLRPGPVKFMPLQSSAT